MSDSAGPSPNSLRGSRASARPGLTLLALTIAAIAVGSLHVALARLYAALAGQPIGSLAEGIALVGLGVGAIVAATRVAQRERSLARSSYSAGLAATFSIVALLVVLHVHAPEGGVGNWRLLPLALASLLPFLFAGALATSSAERAGGASWLLALVGAAVGRAFIGPLLSLGAPRAVLACAIVLTVASLLFYIAARTSPDAAPRARGGVVATFVLAACVLYLGDIGAPWLKLPKLRWADSDKVETTIWTESGVITVEKPTAGVAWMRVDGAFATPILDTKTTSGTSPSELAFVLLQAKGPTLVLEPGGGRDVRAAVRAGQKDIDVAEPSPVVSGELLGNKYKALTGDLYDKPEVHVTTISGRGMLRAAKRKYRAIIASGFDEATPAAAGALALAPNDLLTDRSVASALDHLEDEGVLVITSSEDDFDRLLALATSALRTSGANDRLAEHLFACSGSRVAALLVKRVALAKNDTVQLRRFCQKNKFLEIFAPDNAHGELRRRVTEEPTLAVAVPADHPINLAPPTDDRPFFANDLSMSRLVAAAFHFDTLARDHQGILAALTQIFLGVGALAFVAMPAARRARIIGAWRAQTRFFALVGVASGLAAAAIVPRLAGFLARPAHASSVLGAALLVALAVGGVLAARVRPSRTAHASAISSALLALLLALVAVVAGPTIESVGGAPLFARFSLSLAFLALPFATIGGAVTLGARATGARAALGFGTFLIAASCALAVGAVVQSVLGYSATLLFAGGFAVFSAVTTPTFQAAPPSV
jgi:hypothetical protein